MRQSKTEQVLLVSKKKIRKFGITAHFSEIIKLQFGKERKHCFVLKAYTNIVDAWLPPFFFLDFNNTFLDLFFPHIH